MTRKERRTILPPAVLAISGAVLLSACASTTAVATPPAAPGAGPAAATSAPATGLATASGASTIPIAEGVSPAAYALHQRLMTLDTHLDTPALLVQPGFDIRADNSAIRNRSQVDLPRMRAGGLDGGFWVIYTPQGPLTKEAYQRTRDVAILRSLAIHTMVAASPNDFALATSSTDAARLNAEGKKIVYQSIENSYPLGEDLSLLQTFYDLGVRMVGPVHSGDNQFADSSLPRGNGPRWGGLSPLGKELVKEANRLGVVLDASHASDETLSQMIDLSATPIILSHSGTKELYDHPRNAPDALLVKLARSGGVIHMNALGSYLRKLDPSPERAAALAALAEKYGPVGDIPADRRDAYFADRLALNDAFPEPLASFEDYMDQFLHVLKLVGPEHVGVGADWDGGGGVSGMRDVADLPKITQRLLAGGYTESDLQAIWGGNVIRLLKAAEDHAASLRR
ncbi:membrane dipeptidase [bacterium]|nr:membrane dipeptidase [bacterium]